MDGPHSDECRLREARAPGRDEETPLVDGPHLFWCRPREANVDGWPTPYGAGQAKSLVDGPHLNRCRPGEAKGFPRRGQDEIKISPPVHLPGGF